MTKHNVAPNTPEWLELRKQFRTASEAAIVLGISPWTTPEDFKLIKAGLKTQYYNSNMRRGHELEDQVRQHANDHFDKDFKEEIWSKGKYLASLDGIDGDTLVEIKVSDYTYEELEKGDVPEYYHVQVQQQLHCSPATKGYLYVYSPKRDAYIKSYAIEEDPAYHLKIEEAWEAFDKMPMPEGPINAEGDGDVMKLFHHFAYLKNQAEQIKEQMDDIRRQLIDSSHGKGYKAGGYTLRQSKPRTSYDYKTACTDAKLDLENYKKVGEGTWGITVPKNPFSADE